MKEKKPWVKPQLIILGRGTPEENVLAACKGAPSEHLPGMGTGHCEPGGVPCILVAST